MKWVKRILMFLLLVLVVIQFIRPAQNVAAQPPMNNIATLYPVNAEVRTILDKACNDCHSNNTNYPWYSKIQPVSWWLDDHIKEGKKEINFDEFSTYSLRKQYHKMDEVLEQVKEGEMPFESYTLIHKDADLTALEKKVLLDWAAGIRATMRDKYPRDSLEKRK